MKRSLPKISCLGSVYAGSSVSEVADSINSLINGSLLPDEIVLVIDGPVCNDMHFELTRFEHNGRFKLYPLLFNQGLGNALAQGLSMCSNDVVVRFDTDDLNLEDRLMEIAYTFASDPTLDIVGSSIIEFDPGKQPRVKCRLKTSPLVDRKIKSALNYKNSMNHPSVAFRKSSILSIGSYEHVHYFEDYFLWLKARKARLKFANLNYPLVLMRRPPLSSRRSGIGYALCEISFCKKAIFRGLLNPVYIPLFVLRILSRVLPASLQSFQDHLPWRSPQTHCLNPKHLNCLSISALDMS